MSKYAAIFCLDYQLWNFPLIKIAHFRSTSAFFNLMGCKRLQENRLKSRIPKRLQVIVFEQDQGRLFG
jgi:hypothetical protein